MIYNNRDLTKRGGDGQEEEGGLEKGKRLLGRERSWGFSSSGEGSLLPGTLGRSILCVFHPQNKQSPHQSPTFTPILYKFIVMGLVRKPLPYRNTYNKCVQNLSQGVQKCFFKSIFFYFLYVIFFF